MSNEQPAEPTSSTSPAGTISPGSSTETLRDRRAVLRGAAVAGLAGVSVPLLAACGGDESAGGTTPSPSEPSASGSASAPSTTTASPSTGGGAVLGATADVPVGGGKIFPDAKVVVTQPTEGQFKGYTAVCPHAGCLVSKVQGETIDCACHGSKFKVSDGSVVSGPAREPLATVAVTVQGGNILGPAS